MIRIIVQRVDAGTAAYAGGPVVTTYKTFDLNHPELEAWLREQNQLDQKSVVGAEIVPISKEGVDV